MDQNLLQFNPEDLQAVQQVLNHALSRTGSSAHPSVKLAVEAVLSALGSCDQVAEPLPFGEYEASKQSLLRETAEAYTSVTDGLRQVTAAAQRVSALRGSVANGAMRALREELEGQRPVWEAEDLTVLTPGKEVARHATGVVQHDSLNHEEKLFLAKGKLPSLRAHLNEVSRRMQNALDAMEELKARSKAPTTPLPSPTPCKRTAEPDGVVGFLGWSG